MFLSYFNLIIGFVILVVGAEMLVKGATRFARSFGISTLVIGLTVVAFGTSAPELCVSVAAAWRGTADVAIGNVIGSNIFNVLIIIGLSACIVPLVVTRSVVRREMPIMLLALALFLLFSLDGVISRFEGLLLVIGIVGYLALNFVLYRMQTQSIEMLDLDDDESGQKAGTLRNGAFILAGLIGLVAGAELIVGSASAIARGFGISELVIGVTLVAIGTSLPELATTVVAACKREADLAVGNAIGSNIFNVFCVIGTTALLSPLNVSQKAIDFDLGYMFCACFLVWPLMVFRSRLGLLSGLLMLSGYVVYVYLVFQDQL